MTQIDLKKVLQKQFGFENFKIGQEEILKSLMVKQSTLAVLPTGGGKTLIYQMMGALRPGLVVIVTPLLSLMQDQVARLNYLGEKQVIALNSNLTFQEKQFILNNLSRYHFIFVSPETLNQEPVKVALQQVMINLMVIDEAHTMVTWGQDFRPDYLALPQIHAQLNEPQLLLLTATATPNMMQEIVASFHKTSQNWFIYQQPVDRPNIFLHNEQLANESMKKQRLKVLLQTVQGPGIVYFTSRKLATSMAEWLSNETGLNVVAYHAGMDAISRYRVQQQFMQGDIDVITATSAFGMGIDKEDVRFVIHYHLSNDLANYLQEIGRAGRDGKQAVAILLYVTGDELIQFNLIDQSIPSEFAIRDYLDRDGKTQVTEEQIKLLIEYRHQGLTTTSIIKLFTDRKQLRQNKLQHMIDYAQAKTQLRNRISQYFGDDTQHLPQDTESVGVTAWQPESLNLVRQETSGHITKVSEWSQQLKKLFNLQ